MEADVVSNIIQILVLVAAVGAAIVALVVSAKDRKNAQRIAEGDRAAAAELAAQDRREGLRQAHLMFELEALTKLLENLNRGGSTDPLETRRMGAEALTLIGALGSDRLPHQWERRVGDDERLEAAYEDPEMPEYKKDALEGQLAVNAVLHEIRRSLQQ
ncbi:hypothetical protein [Microbacterium sp. CCH5-D1]|uniref:hypothetical protein n=1 Tax=Microbacterium sp. CCH5-D1 TaxID=1768780 RepID=UPI00076A2711|nr:hypothetical protein [Microbacterium sp. CCH5-D1]